MILIFSQVASWEGLLLERFVSNIKSMLWGVLCCSWAPDKSKSITASISLSSVRFKFMFDLWWSSTKWSLESSLWTHCTDKSCRTSIGFSCYLLLYLRHILLISSCDWSLSRRSCWLHETLCISLTLHLWLLELLLWIWALSLCLS